MFISMMTMHTDGSATIRLITTCLVTSCLVTTRHVTTCLDKSPCYFLFYNYFTSFYQSTKVQLEFSFSKLGAC